MSPNRRFELRLHFSGKRVFAVLPLAVIEIIAAALIVVGVFKPFSRDHIGLFLHADGTFGVLGWISNPGSMREVLGYSAMPIFIFGGLLLFWVSNRLLLSVARGELAGIRRTRLIHLLSKGGPK